MQRPTKLPKKTVKRIRKTRAMDAKQLAAKSARLQMIAKRKIIAGK